MYTSEKIPALLRELRNQGESTATACADMISDIIESDSASTPERVSVDAFELILEAVRDMGSWGEFAHNFLCAKPPPNKKE